ncbi:MAG: SMP-30/gluconolactonase/LRE family protein [Roseiarcus sp.]
MSSAVIDVINEIVFRNRDRLANPVLDGPTRPNSRLEECPVVNAAINEPDDIAFSNDGSVYVTSGHRLIRFSNADFADQTTVAEFDGLATGLSSHPQGGVVVCVAGQGIAFAGGPENGRLLRFEGPDGLKCPTSVVVDEAGVIYVCDGSLDNTPDRWVYDLMEKRRSGRLLRVDPKIGQIEVLESRLAYPNGVCFGTDGQSLIISEAWSHCLLRVPLSRAGSKPSRPNAVAGNLPGYPARIRPFGPGYCLAMFALRTQLVDFVLTEDSYRRKMMETIDPAYWISPALRSEFHYLEPVQGGGLRKHGSLKAWAPPRSYGLVIFLDEDFEPQSSLHSRVGGSCHGITGVAEHDGDVYVTSKGSSKIVKLVRAAGGKSQ